MNTFPANLHNGFINLTSEIELGAEVYLSGYHGGLRSLRNRISHKLSATLRFKSYPMTLKRPMISFTFDDIAQSAAFAGADILEKHNVNSTFYVASDLIGRHISGAQKASIAEIQVLQKKGHEIALHSHSHLPAFAYSRFGFKADLIDNKSILSQFLDINQNPNYCYPYGISTFQSKIALQNLARSARCLWRDINHTRLDPYFLRATMLDSAYTNIVEINRLIDLTIKKNGWLIFISHSVGEEKANLSTPTSYLNHALRAAKDNNFEIVTINEGLNRLSVS